MIPNGSPPLSGIAAAYGSTVLGDQLRQPRNIAEILGGGAPKAGISAIESPKPHEQLSQIVSTFLNSVIEHIVQRVVNEVVSEIKPKLVDPWMYYSVERRYRAQAEAEEKEARIKAETEWKELIGRRWCSHGGDPVCRMWWLREEISKIENLEIMEIPWNLRHYTVGECSMRLAIGHRLFEINGEEIRYIDGQRAELSNEISIREITTDNHLLSEPMTIEHTLDVVTRIATGEDLITALLGINVGIEE